MRSHHARYAELNTIKRLSIEIRKENNYKKKLKKINRCYKQAN